MSDIFISYAQADRVAALATQKALLAGGATAFLAENSVEPGSAWASEVERQIRGAGLVLVLASREASRSAWVQHEVGIAVGARRKIIPVVWDMPPSGLPGVLAGYQALDLAGRTEDQAQRELHLICKRIHADKVLAFAAIGGLVCLLAKFG